LTDEFGGLKLDGFSDRLTLQKRVYLLQHFGIDLGYRYNWYVHGPYSPSLTEEAYGLSATVSEVRKLSEGYQLSPDAKKRIGEYRRFEDDLPEQDLPRSLEIAASIHFLKHVGFVPGGITRERIMKELSERGKDFSDDEVDRIWSMLSKHDLLV